MSKSTSGVCPGCLGALASYLLLLALVSGCEQQTPPAGNQRLPEDGTVIAFIGGTDCDSRWAALRGGARLAAKAYPMVRLEALTPNADGLDEAVQRALNLDARAVCLFLAPGADGDRAVRKLTGAGAYVVTIGPGARHELAFAHVRVDSTGASDKLAEQLRSIAAGKRSCMLLHWEARSESDAHCRARFNRRAHRQHGVSVLCERDATSSKTSPTEIIRDMFATFPRAGLIVTLDPQPWLTATPAELLGENAGFATIGAFPALWPALRAGEATALCGPLDGEVGRRAVELALGAITQSAKPGRVWTMDCELVTPDLLDDFARRYAEAAGVPFDELTAPASRPTHAPARQSDQP